MSLVDITTTESLTQALLVGDHKKKAVLLFGATWHEACPKLRMVLQALASSQKDDKKIVFCYVDAETSELSDLLGVTLVPTLILLNSGGNGSGSSIDDITHNVLERLEGGILEPAQVTLAVQRLMQAPEGYTLAATVATVPTAAHSANEAGTTPTTDNAATTTKKALQDRLERLIRGDTVMLFMKGRPDAPRCGFSRQAVEVLKEQEVPFGSFDILSDDDVRQGLKKLSDWPTYPQIYVKGELMGGLDILKETAAEGSLKEQWEIDDNATSNGNESINERLSKLVNRSDTMLFMKGLPSAPQCGFSRQIVSLLDETGVPYDAFNILEDDDIRQGLKEFSDWPTYPQLYHKGELLGGLDIVQELKESGELHEMLSEGA